MQVPRFVYPPPVGGDRGSFHLWAVVKNALKFRVQALVEYLLGGGYRIFHTIRCTPQFGRKMGACIPRVELLGQMVILCLTEEVFCQTLLSILAYFSKRF